MVISVGDIIHSTKGEHIVFMAEAINATAMSNGEALINVGFRKRYLRMSVFVFDEYLI
jgi:hypothetical protein